MYDRVTFVVHRWWRHPIHEQLAAQWLLLLLIVGRLYNGRLIGLDDRRLAGRRTGRLLARRRRYELN